MPTLSESVAQLIDSDLTHTSQLIQLLEAERSAIESRDSEALQRAVDAKPALLNELQNNAALREALIKQQGLDGSTDDWRALLKKLPEPQCNEAIQNWSVLEQKLRRCSDLIDTNSLIVSRTQRTVGRLLDILRGQGAVSGVNMYNSSGRTQVVGDNRPITTA